MGGFLLGKQSVGLKPQEEDQGFYFNFVEKLSIFFNVGKLDKMHFLCTYKL